MSVEGTNLLWDSLENIAKVKTNFQNNLEDCLFNIIKDLSFEPIVAD